MIEKYSNLFEFRMLDVIEQGFIILKHNKNWEILAIN
jgi:hypothetical protein